MIKIRSLKRNDDFDDLIALSREFFQEYGAYHKDFFNITEIKDEQVINYFSSFCGDHSRKAFIAVDAGRTVGYITVYINELAEYWKITKVGDISGLMVKKEYRRMGVAEKLLEEAKLFFKEHKLDYYTVFTAVANQGAIDFYRKNGMAPLYSTLIGEVTGVDHR
jgi:ribosomal protein S18 acetylase RimI-like enzyme